MLQFLAGAMVGGSIGMVISTILINAKQLDRELSESLKKWADDLKD